MTSNNSTKLRIVVVGNGMVGHHFLTALPPDVADVTIIAAEPRVAYDRVHLSELFAGQDEDSLALGSVAEYQAAGYTCYFGEPVTAIDREANEVVTDQRRVPYDKLVLATGSYPFVPPVPGADLPGCLEYRTIDDLHAIRQTASNAKRGVVVGGGLLGLECANALKNLDLETHVVEFAPGLMTTQLDTDGSTTLASHIRELGVTIHTSKATQEITATASGLRMTFAEGEPLETDLIVFSAGIRPHDALAREAQLNIGERGGIVIDNHCRTNDPDIYAIGECALFEGRIFGLVAPGYRMAEAVAKHLTGDSEARFDGADMSTRLKLLGVEVGAIGDAHGRTEGARGITYCDPINDVYARLNIDASGRRVLGAVLVGDAGQYDTILQYYLNDMPLPESPGALLVGGAEIELAGDQLPDTATICSCHNVSKGQVISAIDSGCASLGDLKADTKASTGCGGCAALLKSVFESELEARGVVVDKSICEHFAYTREELFHLCKLGGIDNFADLLARHGSGRGCDICKPTAASIFASLYNAHILTSGRAALQDTNDRLMANMQKNGTYSVVPRIPGGEITPEKLIVIGEVARKYDLYTKITGGQRIDLFGAQAHELPAIWAELIAAGFETGHAYGKAVRTVKSCVGSTWCRYGVQDSVGMALFIENRYKGLRSPHKLKLAVSGCTRECAEAQSKDVGVIATEGGWNLYVAGNGGMRPRHADLFATDLDDETLIRYIDRFLMFYVKTADRLQRTSVWLESLEGGLEYVQQVVIEDSLDIAADLEGMMANIIGTYQCEWKTALEDPEQLKQFRTFVNSPDADPDIRFTRERGQRRPADARDDLIATG